MTGWALYPWFEEHGESLVHREDIAAFRRLFPYGKVFAIDTESGDFVTLRYGSETFRVRPKLLRPVPAPAFVFGQGVSERGRDRAGTIGDIKWHFNRNRPYFLLLVEGRRHKKRLWEEDLIASSPFRS